MFQSHTDDPHRVTGSSIDVEDIRPHLQNHQNAAPVSNGPLAQASSTESSRELTFLELKELIEQGKTDQIPNNRNIPNVLSVRNSILALVISITAALTNYN